MAEIQPAPPAFEFSADIVIIGAGACGLVAGLAAREDCPEEASILLLERDRSPSGSTSLSSGFMPAAGTWLQREQGLEDSPELLLQDLQNKAKGRSHEPLASAVAAASGPVVEWLCPILTRFSDVLNAASAATARPPFHLMKKISGE